MKKDRKEGGAAGALVLAGLLICGLTAGQTSAQAANAEHDAAAVGAESPAAGSGTAAEEAFYKNWLAGRLQLGTRSVYRFLTDKDSGHKGGTYGTGTFLGTIYGLDEKQDYSPTRLFLAYYFSKYLGIEFAYDSITAKTVAMDTDLGRIKTDGNANLSGPTVSLIGRYRNSTALTPYAGIGMGFFNGDFDEDPVWAHEIWWGYANRNRQMVVDSTTAFLLTGGATWAFTPNWLVDMSLQYIHADADATFYGDIDGVIDTTQTGHFPMDNVALRLGITYSF